MRHHEAGGEGGISIFVHKVSSHTLESSVSVHSLFHIYHLNNLQNSTK